MGSEDDQFIDSNEEFDVKKDSVATEETEETESDDVGLGDVEDPYDADKGDDDDPYTEIYSLLDPYGIKETF